MKKPVSIAALALCAAAASAFARPVLQPEVKEYAAFPGAADYSAATVVFQDQEQCRIGADEILSRGRRSAYAGGGLPDAGVCIAVVDSDFGKKLAAAFSLDVPTKKQGYAIRVDGAKAAIVGFDAVGAFYGAETFRQMMADGGRVESCAVRDWPDILYRGTASAGRGLWHYTSGETNRLPMMKAAIDELARMKFNIIFDHFRVTPDSDEKTFAFWREVNHYAAARGIYANDYGSTALLQRRNYPKDRKFEDWPCVRDKRSWNEWYYCWSDDEATERMANEYADYIVKAGMEKGILVIHPVDGGFTKDPEMWSKRCERCRARWGDGERWKASANLFGILSRVLRARLPEAMIGSCIYPYSFNSLATTPESERTPKWRESTVEYWRNLSESLEDKEFFFSSWICSPLAMREIRKLVPGRPFHFSDTYTQASGVFQAFHRKACTVWEPQSENMFCSMGTPDVYGCWESWALISECTWNKDSSAAELYDGGTYYDPLTDHAGDTPVFTEVLPRICRTFWGTEVASHMTAVMGSGVMPGYILDPPRHVKYWNIIRRDPQYDPMGGIAQTEKTKFEPIVDSPALMEAQVKAAEICVRELAAAEPKARKLPPVQRRYFMKLAKQAPFWLAAARTRHIVRAANELVAKGDNEAALALVAEGRERMEADFAYADANKKRLAGEPDAMPRGWSWGFDNWKFGVSDARKMVDRAEASAKVVMSPRKIGRFVKVGITKAAPSDGVLKWFSRFENVKAEVFEGLSLASLDAYDCVIILDKPYEKDEFFSNLRTYAERGGGGVYLEGPLCGSRRWDSRTPFPDVVETSPERIDNPGQDMKFADGHAGKTMYIDFFAIQPGPKGEVRAYGPDGKTPLAVRGEAGLGKVFFNGTFSLRSAGGTYDVENGAELDCANAELMRDAVEYFTGVRLKLKDE